MTFRLTGFSAVDRYLGLPALPFVWAETSADVGALARAFEGLRFPGVGLADAAYDGDGQTRYFRCQDPDDPYYPSYSILSLTQDETTRRFRDPAGIYPLLRALRAGGEPEPAQAWRFGLNPAADAYQAAMDAALILARYAPESRRITEITAAFPDLPKAPPPNAEAQRVLLTCLLGSPRPDLGMNLLKRAGFIGELWPELALLDEVDQAKEFHPEGNVWNHTLETFRYRKTGDFRLALGLLLHDAGKPLAKASGARRFDGHAELGANQARRFLKRLGFGDPLIGDVQFLVKNHMIPAALPRLPFTVTKPVLESPLFPTLLELYRCDESASFKGLEGYYESGAAYQAYLCRRRNPYRSEDGKKR